MSNLSKCKRVLITGSSRGIGLGLVRSYLANSNLHVIATCRSPGSATDLSSLQSQYGDRLLILPMDVSKKSSCDGLRETLNTKGIDSIDILIANAGIAPSRSSLLETTDEDMNSAFQTNVNGSMFTAQVLHDLVCASSGKLFVMVSSIMGSVYETSSPFAASYRVSKAALNMVSMMLAHEAPVQNSGGRVVVLHPGWVNTDMGSSAGRTPPLSVEQSVSGISSVIESALSVQFVESTEPSDPVSRALKSNGCVYVSYAGSISISMEEKTMVTASTANAHKVYLISQEGERFEAGLEVVRLSGLIDTMIDDDVDVDETQEIPLPNVRAEVLANVIKFMECYKATPYPPIEKPIQSSSMHDIVPAWYADFVTFDRDNEEMLFELILAANFMDIKSLLDLGCAALACILRNKTPDQIRERFDIPNEFTPAEVDEVKSAIRWIDDGA